jgi:hypothetical protein
MPGGWYRLKNILCMCVSVTFLFGHRPGPGCACRYLRGGRRGGLAEYLFFLLATLRYSYLFIWLHTGTRKYFIYLVFELGFFRLPLHPCVKTEMNISSAHCKAHPNVSSYVVGHQNHSTISDLNHTMLFKVSTVSRLFWDGHQRSRAR